VLRTHPFCPSVNGEGGITAAEINVIIIIIL
jgi:hypothetical protein